MREIPLTQDKVALVDDEDYEALNAFKWFVKRDRDTSYAMRNVRGKPTKELIHRVVLARKLGRTLAKGERADHINGDGLDNRRENLRQATHAQNMRNCRRHSVNPSSRYLGVRWYKHTRKWLAQIKIDSRPIYLGTYRTENEAALAREFYIVAHPELHARSNFSEHELTL
jgi:hypothetical protein